ncbi:hypothetical protein L1987_24926 [Smallanthus sonchifolius]|uniref:Uncharacterized protein n=1 Tax=Smallanthus sonchifolius TaxID=185202 RepID=A0ACB9IMQ4_9ASTR|nr:hypothetical protein L1987_24926 [Smallanthus sonchifolius]
MNRITPIETMSVIDAKGEKALAIFPAKFQKSMWIKRGSFVVVDDGGREEAIESGRKVTCVVVQVLFHEQVRVLQKSPEWPEIFKSVMVNSSNGNSQRNPPTTQENSELDSCEDDDDGLPPLEANTNRRPTELQSATESDSDIEVS